MKKSIIFFAALLLLSVANASTEAMSGHTAALRAVDLPNCPEPHETDFEVSSYIDAQSADSRIHRGQCKVLAPLHIWWDLHLNTKAQLQEVDVGNCSSDDFIAKNGKTFVKGVLSFKATVSRCQSKLGCKYTCEPIVKLYSF